MPTKADEEELSIYAEPLSSDEEEFVLIGKPYAHPPAASSEATKSSPLRKRTVGTAAATRSMRKRTQVKPAADTFIVPEKPTIADAFPGWDSSSSQKRKLHRSYAHRKYGAKIEPVERKPVSGAPERGFVSYAEVEKKETPISKAAFINVSPVSARRSTRGNPQPKQFMEIPGIPQKESDAKLPDFRIPDLPDPSSSALTPGIDEAFTHSPVGERRARSGSTSSLSSVDSLLLLTNYDKYKMEPELSGRRCPVCQQPVRDSESLFVPDNLDTMPYHQQRNFCARHQLTAATDEWQKRKYPKIDWEELENSRIPLKVPSLKQVISGQKPSFYLKELEARIKAAKGNRKKLRTYLNEGLVDIAKPGYYGPRGAKIMVNAITESLASTLHKALQSDPALRAAGVGAYVSAVLVPELTLQLVMEDLGLRTAEEGRQVLEGSTELGVHLHPDDDHIEREEDD